MEQSQDKIDQNKVDLTLLKTKYRDIRNKNCEKLVKIKREIFINEITEMINILSLEYGLDIVFRAFYFTFLLDIYSDVQTINELRINNIDLNKMNETSKLDFINKIISYLSNFYIEFLKNNIKCPYTNIYFINDINYFKIKNVNRQMKQNENFKKFYCVCYNLYQFKKSLIKSKNNLKCDINDVNNVITCIYGFNSQGYDILDDYITRNYNSYLIESPDKSLIRSLKQAYIFGDELYYPIEKYFGKNDTYNIFMTKLYKYYINEIPYFDEYFKQTQFYNEKKYKLPKNYYEIINYLDDITDDYYD